MSEAVDQFAEHVGEKALAYVTRAVEAAHRPDKGLKLRDAAAKLGISTRTFQTRVQAGELPPKIAATGTWSEKELDLVLAGKWKGRGRGRRA